MRRLLLLTTGVLTCYLLELLPVWAAPPGLLPPAQTQGPVTYVRGGIGPEEAQAFAAAMAHYPLALAFAATHRPHATFLTTVHVTVSDLQGRSILDTRSQGPFLLATLPAGDYTLNAWYRDQTLEFISICGRISRRSSTWRTRSDPSVGCGPTLSLAVSSAVASERGASVIW